MQVEGQHGTSVLMATGARVSNAYATYLQEGNSPGKLGLMPHGLMTLPGVINKAEALGDRRASY